MNVFDTHAKIVADYASYIRSFINIADPAISQKVDEDLAERKLWPEPLLQFNPAYELAGMGHALQGDAGGQSAIRSNEDRVG